MAQITIRVPDELMPRVLDAFCSVHGYQPFSDIDQSPNLETKIAFVKRLLIEYLKESVKTIEGGQAAHVTRQQVERDLAIL